MHLKQLIISPHFLLFFSLPAAWGASPACLNMKQLEKVIVYCKDNALAVASAEACLKESLEEWEAAAPELAALKNPAPLESQKLEVERNLKKYGAASKKVTELVERMQAKAAQMESYPRVMVDRIDILQGGEPLDCYQDAFTKIESTLSALDKKIVAGLYVLGEASFLEARLEAVLEKIDSSKSLVRVETEAGDQAPRNPASHNPNQRGFRPSDISGTEKNKGEKK